jgi:hypothetical protein
MGDVVTTRAMEAFLIHPTEMSDRYAESQPSTLETRQRSDQLASQPGKRSLHHHQESFPDPVVEQVYWHRYDSDEEAISSAVDSDTESISSASSGEILEMTRTRFSVVSAKELANSYDPIEQTVFYAQAVVMQPVNTGDAKLSPRLVEIPPSPRHERHRSMGYYKPSKSRLSKLDTSTPVRHLQSVASTPRSSIENSSNASNSSTPPTSVDDRSPVSSTEKKVIRRKSAVSSMRSVAKREFSINAHNMPDAQTLREFLDSDPYSDGRPLSQVPAPGATPSKRKLRKFSSSFSLGRFKRISSADNSSDDLPTLASLRSRNPPAPEVYRPSRCSTFQPTLSAKMVARGANERAPPIVLPPCPDDSTGGLMRGQLQRSPKSYSPTGAPKTGKLHRRQKSLSADDLLIASS